MKRLPGFSLVELLVVVVILGVVATVGAITFMNHLDSVRSKVMVKQFDFVEDFVVNEIEFMENGISSALMIPGTNTIVNPDTTCGEFLDALKEEYGYPKTPIDGSPLLTFSTAHRGQQKAGKIRITCYKALHAGYSNGSRCKMRDAAIRVDTFKADCGGVCGTSVCQIPNAKCLADISTPMEPGEWFSLHESNKTYGKLVKLKPDNTPDFTTAKNECGLAGLDINAIPLEPDY